MAIKIQKTLLKYDSQYETHALAVLPDITKEPKPSFAIFAHGYTSHKGSLFNWSVRLAEEGIATLIFDLPGHYFGNYSEVTDFEYFKTRCPELFAEGLNSLKEQFLESFPLSEHLLDDPGFKVILGGHSLGAMFSLKAMELPALASYNKINISVGLGMAPENVVHIFDTPFYKSTLIVREQLVSPAIGPDKVFPWIKQAKEVIKLSGHRIILLSGKDDMVVGDNGAPRFGEHLSALGNDVKVVNPEKLAHHTPENAGPFIKKIVKEEGLI